MTRQMVAVITDVVFVGSGFITCLIFGLFYIKNTVDEYIDNRACMRIMGKLPPRKPPGFLTLAYRSIKNKICYQVKFK